MSTPTLLALTFAPYKKGKTVETLQAFPRGIFIAAPGALSFASSPFGLGYVPSQPVGQDGRPVAFRGIDEVTSFLVGLGDRAGDFDVVVIDDLSLLLTASVNKWGKEPEQQRNRYYKFGRLESALTTLADIARYDVRLHVWASCHERAPETVDGVAMPGGPLVPSRWQTGALPAWADMVLRMRIDTSYPDPWWPGVFWANSTDYGWITGDRTGVVRGSAPANPAELLRYLGYVIRRLPGLEWQDDVAEGVAVRLWEAASGSASGAIGITPDMVMAVTRAVFEQLSSFDPRHVRWAVRDGLARAVFRLQGAHWRETLGGAGIKPQPVAGMVSAAGSGVGSTAGPSMLAGPSLPAGPSSTAQSFQPTGFVGAKRG